MDHILTIKEVDLVVNEFILKKKFDGGYINL